MKKIINILSLTLLLALVGGWTSGVYAQDAKTVMSKITSGIKAGNAGQVAQYFSDNLELAVPGADKRYAKNQAQFVLKDFFAKYPVQSYVVEHQGNSGSNYYAIGKYKSAKGAFDTNVLLSNSGGKFSITEIRFEK